MKMILNTVRMVDNDQMREHSFGDDNSLKENLAIGFLNPEDINKLNLTSSSNLKLSNDNGEVIIKVQKDENIPQGIILMPISIWANQLTVIKKNSLVFKNININVEETKESVLDVRDLIENIIK